MIPKVGDYIATSYRDTPKTTYYGKTYLLCDDGFWLSYHVFAERDELGHVRLRQASYGITIERFKISGRIITEDEMALVMLEAQ